MTRLTALLLLLLPAIVLAQPAAAPKNPKLANLQIEIWPEYDRPAALIILNGEVAPEVTLPASITLRLPGASGGVHAIASASREDAPLINVEHTAKSAGDALLVSFQVSNRFFHVEYYDALATQAPERRYTFVWPGDFTAARSMVMLQEPANSSEVAMEPQASAATIGQNGLRYRSADLGALQAGKPVKVEVRYTKPDARTSSEVLQPKGQEAAPAGAAPRRPGTPAWLYGALAALAVIAAALGFIVWYERRARRAAAPAPHMPPAPKPTPASTVRTTSATVKGKKKRRAK